MAAMTLDATTQTTASWKILIVDDEPEVHQVTRVVLSGFRFEARALQFLSASSADEAISLMQEHPDIAVMLLDVVMETEDAGLRVVRHVRETLGNTQVRIVLRTGQPGQAPEQNIISVYDINDYKEKTELTAQRLFTTLFVALRGYRDLMTIEASKRGLERVLQASANVFAQRDGPAFAASVMAQLPHLAPDAGLTLLCRVQHGVGSQYRYPIMLSSGDDAELVGRSAEEVLPLPRIESLHRALRKRRHVFSEDHFVLHFTDSEERESLLYVGESPPFGDVDRQLMEVFSANVAIAFKNLHLNKDLLDSQFEMIWLLAGAAETRSRETANHVKRVGMLAELLGRAYGLDSKATEALRLAAPLHDIGKIGIPDAILNKPGPHTEEETRIMRSHARLGAQLLSSSRRPLLQMASHICLEHHENWDGSGYPSGLSGEDISLEGRIVALADVFDALGSERCYKDAWELVRIRSFVSNQSGRKFDPRLVTLLFENWEEAEELRREYPDE